MDDELLPGEAPLVGVMDAGVGKRRLDVVAIDRQRLTGVLLDDREQVTQQALLKRGELGVLDDRLAARAGETVDARAARGQDGGDPVPVGLVAGGARVTAADGSAQAPAR
jgi:hypothetical protein